MRRMSVTTAALIALGLASLAPCIAQADTVNTYDFRIDGWTIFPRGQPDSSSILTGSFTAVVEPNGLIEQADLKSFTAKFSPYLFSWTLSDLSLFSFNTNGGASSLDFVVGVRPEEVGTCVGAAALFAADCTIGFEEFPPSGTLASIVVGNHFLTETSSTQPTIALESSLVVTPLPPALSLFATALLGVCLFGWRKRKAQAVAA